MDPLIVIFSNHKAHSYKHIWVLQAGNLCLIFIFVHLELESKLVQAAFAVNHTTTLLL